MRISVISFAVGVAAAITAVALPFMVDLFSLLSMTVYLIMALLALSLAFVGGHGGILCFGQAAFFGLGAYTWAISAFNFGPGLTSVALAIALPAAFAALLGYFMFYGKISDVYLGVITLAVTLILFNLMNSTSGDSYRIGEALLGGFNGIPSIPPLTLPGAAEPLSPEGTFTLAALLLIAAYFGLRAVMASRFGRVVAAVRENEQRALLLGYNASLYKLAAFTLGGALAGLAGMLYANWGSFVSPGVFSLSQSAQIIIWVIVGGRGTLIGPIITCVALQAMVTQLGAQHTVDTGLVLGAILILFVLLIPRGLAPTIADAVRRLTH